MAAIMRAARRRGVLSVVRCGAGPLSRVRAHALPAQHFAPVIKVAGARFKADKHILDALVHQRFGARDAVSWFRGVCSGCVCDTSAGRGWCGVHGGCSTRG